MLFFFFFNDTATTEIYTLSLHDALPILKLEVPLVAGVALVPAPDLHGRAGVAHQRRDRGAHTATGDAVRPIGRARSPHSSPRPGPRVVPFRVEPLRAQRNLTVGAQRAASAREVSVGEEVAKPRVRQVLLDAAPHLFPTPLAARAIGALGQPATQRDRKSTRLNS